MNPGSGDGQPPSAAGPADVESSTPGSHGPLAFLFTDIEDSTVLWELHPSGMAAAVATHDRVVTAAVEGAGGRVVQRVGDAMDAVFDELGRAVEAAVAAQRELAGVDWGEVGELRVRMAVDVGEVDERQGKFFGGVLNRAGRMLAAGHGGQVLLSAEAAGDLDGAVDGVGLRLLGTFRFKGLTGAQEVFQVTAEGLEGRFPPLRVDHPGGVRAGRSRSVWGYELGEEVGDGRLGTVYRALQPSSGREVAVRAVRPELVNDAWFVRRFEAEARIVARLDHLHLVGLRDFWRDPEGAFLVVPWLEGGSLEDALAGGPWGLGSAARMISQVGSALVYLHERGVVHGGVGPSNVLLDAEGDAFLADAWLPARLVDGRSGGGASETGDLRGLALLVASALVGQVLEDPVRLPVVSELRPEVDDAVDRAIDQAVSVGAADDLSVRGFLEAVLPALEAGLEVAEPVRNPYKGLAAFGEADAADFFGREELLPALVEAVAEVPLVAVVGPSGSGKSSVVRAGLVPAVHRGTLGGEWMVTDLLPGSEPLVALESALLRVATERPSDLAGMLRSGPDGLGRAVEQVLPDDGSRLLLVIDQFEELFVLAGEADRRLLLDALVALAGEPDGRVRVVVTLRADFFDRPLDYPEFGALLKDGLVPVSPLDAEGLATAVVGPARNVGVEVEAALVAEIVADVGEEPGGLPLVQFTMTELFERRGGDTLTVEAYREAGGVTGALARRAEEVFSGLPADAQEAARQVFLRLVALGEGTEDTRRRVPRGRVMSLPGHEVTLEVVLERFGENRLVSFDRDPVTREPTVEVAHEALLRHWPRLRGWVDAAREDLRSHRRLRAAVSEWQEAGQATAYLLAPERVEATDAWLADSQVALSDDETRYLDASRRRKQALEAAEAERTAHEEALERRAITRMRATIAVLIVGILVAGVLAAFAFEQRGTAEEQRVAAEAERATAERAERVATARGLASAATAQLGQDPELAILLGIESVATTRDADGDVLPEAETALRRAVRESHLSHRLEIEGGFGSVSVSPDGDRVAALGMEGTLVVWDAHTWGPLLELEGMSHAALAFYDDLAFTPDGSSIVVSDDELRGAVRDVRTGEASVEFEGMLARPQVSPDGQLVAGVLRREVDSAMEADPTIGVWDAATGALLRTFDIEGIAFGIAFSPDSTRLAVAGGRAHVWDVETGEEVWATSAEAYWVVDFHPDGEMLVVSGGMANVDLLQAEDGALLYSFLGHEASVQAGVFSQDGGRLATGDQEGVTRIWDVASRRQLLVLAGHAGPLADAVFLPDGEQLVTASRDGTARVWDVRGIAGHEYAAMPAPVPPIAGNSRFGPDGRFLATPGMDGARVWELDTMEEVLFLQHERPVPLVAFSADGRLVATTSVDGYPEGPPPSWVDEVHLWDAESGDRLWTIEDETHYSDLVFSPDGSRFAAVGRDAARVFDTGTGETVFSYPISEQGLRGLYVLDGEGLVVAGAEETVLLDPETGDRMHVVFEGAMSGIAHVDQETIFLVDGSSANILEFDLRTGEEVRVVRDEPLGPSVDVEVRDGVLYIARGETLTVRDLETGERRFDLELAPNIWSFDVSPDNRYLVTNHRPPWTYVYVVQTDDLLDLAHERLTRWWTDAECEEFLQRDCPEPVG